MMGVSRSATVICAYLVATRGMTAEEAISFTKSQRGVVRPNNGFARQLKEYEKQIRLADAGATSSTLSALQDRLRKILDSHKGSRTIGHRLVTERTLSSTSIKS